MVVVSFHSANKISTMCKAQIVTTLLLSKRNLQSICSPTNLATTQSEHPKTQYRGLIVSGFMFDIWLSIHHAKLVRTLPTHMLNNIAQIMILRLLCNPTKTCQGIGTLFKYSKVWIEGKCHSNQGPSGSHWKIFGVNSKFHILILWN